jgi:hypothetical protein
MSMIMMTCDRGGVDHNMTRDDRDLYLCVETGKHHIAGVGEEKAAIRLVQ